MVETDLDVTSKLRVNTIFLGMLFCGVGGGVSKDGVVTTVDYDPPRLWSAPGARRLAAPQYPSPPPLLHPQQSHQRHLADRGGCTKTVRVRGETQSSYW